MQSIKWEVAASCPKGCPKSTPSREFMCLCSLLHIKNEHKRRNERGRRVHSTDRSLGSTILLSHFAHGLLHCSLMLSHLPFPNRRAGPVGGGLLGDRWVYLCKGYSSELTAQRSVQHQYPSTSPKDSAFKHSPRGRQGYTCTPEFRAVSFPAELVPLLLGYVNREGLRTTGACGL